MSQPEHASRGMKNERLGIKRVVGASGGIAHVSNGQMPLETV
ncbi:MAG: hypothetical protein A4E55_02359 [Pelotomaculum sp. PtaU1.Bin035]|nr:MAG: hypothetical protein A4E55_02359 [Pelotomaculum sp. PtaU1.Bin035]